MNTPAPLISIGLPVHNEEKHIHEAISALRAQSYSNIEIIISDNASEDKTLNISETHKQKDKRIRIIKNKTNLGVAENSRTVLSHATGEYFMWASGHDLWHKNHLEEALKAYQAHPHATICFAANNWIDDKGSSLIRASGWSDTIGLGPCSRVITTILGSMNPVLGLIKTSALRSIPKIYGCVGADLIVLTELALAGPFVNVAETTWARREFRNENYRQKVKRYKSDSFNLVESKWSRIFPKSFMLIKLNSAVLRSKITPLQKTLLLVTIPLILLIKLADFGSTHEN